ncbi:hypothetical protein [Brumimicrobium oceani]|uniref:Uncharacterized protein n=1 Tax=Brumimicrobium oceani TaxID=2100725 RepID=A0A2U2XD01_9FLAO|nr:hypothetical protein [Brumimicrobium oceani]PWH85637.1 hypothetical protein DIT68_08345 [Brumimicrobium oceani]
MKNVAFLIASGLLMFSCSNEKNQTEEDIQTEKEEIQETVSDSTPDAEWNGEYMKIKDEEEPKVKRKSQGSDFYSMGRVDLKIGENQVDFKLFERKKNALTFTNESITAFIRSAFNEDIKVRFKKKDIVINHKGKYKADPSEKANNSFSMTILAGEQGKQKEYTLESGEAEIIAFSPRLGTLEMKIKSIFVKKDGTKQNGEGMIKMNFENAVMTAI